MKFTSSSLTLLVALSGGAMTAHAADTHAGHTMSHEVKLPTEGGQSGFAAIAEIVTMLSEDPNTDWAAVNIDKLRAHLVDMNELTLYADVAQLTEGNSVIFNVSGETRALKAAKAMIPAHAVELNKIDGWQVDVDVKTDHVVMRVGSDDVAILAKIKGLGFFGMMATGAHHQPHHWGMATGAMIGH